MGVANNRMVFEAIRPWLDSRGFTAERIRALDDVLADYARAVVGEPSLPPLQRLSPSPACYRLIMDYEGLHKQRADGMVEAYPDPATGGAPWTIGYGTTGPDVRRGTVWSREECISRFQQEVREKFGAGVLRLIADRPTTQNQFDALVSFAYNVGLDEDSDTVAEGLGDSSLLRLHRAGKFAEAAVEFSKWVNANGRPMNGLRRRRAAEAALYRGEL